MLPPNLSSAAISISEASSFGSGEALSLESIPGTVQRIFRPFAAASVAVGSPRGARNEWVPARDVARGSLVSVPPNG